MRCPTRIATGLCGRKAAQLGPAGVRSSFFFSFTSTSTLACYPALVLGLKYQTDTRKHPRLQTPPIQSRSHTPPAPIGDQWVSDTLHFLTR